MPLGRPMCYRDLHGTPPLLQSYLEELAKLPLDGVLGFLAARSVDLLSAGPRWAEPGAQLPWLRLAMDDDYPATAIGFTTEHQFYDTERPDGTVFKPLLHEHNMAWLADQALRVCKRGTRLENFDLPFRRRLSRLLLLANDHLDDLSPRGAGPTLSIRRQRAEHLLRYSTFDRFAETPLETLVRIARQRVLFRILQEPGQTVAGVTRPYFATASALFEEATEGISLDRYFEALVAVVNHIHVGMKNAQWLDPTRFWAQIEDDAVRTQLDAIFRRRWLQTPEQYDRRRTEWGAQSLKAPADGYDFAALRERPIIEARPGEGVSPVLAQLLAKIEDDPYFILVDHLKTDRLALMEAFQRGMGHAYQNYAHSLVERLAKASGYSIHHPSDADGNDEHADSYMQKGDLGIVFEHKAMRLPTGFLRGGEGSRVLGPDEPILERLERGETVSPKEGRHSDNGVLTRGMWQQSRHGAALLDWAQKKTGTRPTKLVPIITHLTDVKAIGAYEEYLRLLRFRAGLYGHPWIGPRWLQIRELEVLTAGAEVGAFDITKMVGEVDRWPYKEFGGVDQDLQKEVGALATLMAQDLFPASNAKTPLVWPMPPS